MTNTTQRPIGNQVEGQSQVDERLRQAILDKKQAQIEAWSQQIEQLQQALQSVSSELRVETEKRVIELTEPRSSLCSGGELATSNPRELGNSADPDRSSAPGLSHSIPRVCGTE